MPHDLKEHDAHHPAQARRLAGPRETEADHARPGTVPASDDPTPSAMSAQELIAWFVFGLVIANAIGGIAIFLIERDAKKAKR